MNFIQMYLWCFLLGFLPGFIDCNLMNWEWWVFEVIMMTTILLRIELKED